MSDEQPGGQPPSEGKKSGQGRRRRWRRRSDSRGQPGGQNPAPPAQDGAPAVKDTPGGEPSLRRRRGGGGQNQPASQANSAQPSRQNPTEASGGGRRRRSSRGRGDRAGATTAPPTTAPGEPRAGEGQPKPGNRGQGRRRRDDRRERVAQPSAPAGQERTPQGRAPHRAPRQNLPGKPNQRRRTPEREPGKARPPQAFSTSTPLKARGGIKARSEGGEFGKNWWAKRWLLAMERLMDGARLQRGRRYARMGQVLSMNEVDGDVVAKVQGSRPQPYKVIISVTDFSAEQWEQVLDVLAGRAIFAAQLLAGEMPPNIEDAFSAAGVSLFPARGGDLHTECSCPDWANPCKHIAATQYILADRFDEDPFLLFRMRGRTQESILQALRLRRTGSETVPELEPEPQEPPEPLEAGIEHFWEMGPGLEDFSVNIQQPQIALPLFRRLGEPDVAGGQPLEETLGPALDSISQTALLLAFTDTSREPTENGDSA